jgi:MFS family permease
VNGTFWIGGAVGSLTAIYLLSGKAIGGDHSWRFALGIGGVLGIVIFLLRLSVPESPRWLMLRGQEQLADELVCDIEAKASRNRTDSLPQPEGDSLKIKVRDHTPWREIFSNMLGENRQRTYLGLILMVSQAFFFNAVFFSYGLVGKTFFHISDRQIPWHLLLFTVASFLGPLSIGRLFDTVGRKQMIAITCGAAGLLLAGTTIPFATGHIGARGVGISFSIIFFIASSAANAAYLTVSEIFPLELRAFAIAVFYALGTLIGGVGAPLLFGLLIQAHSRTLLALGYGLGALLMIIAAICETSFGVEAAGKSLEAVSKPYRAIDTIFAIVTPFQLHSSPHSSGNADGSVSRRHAIDREQETQRSRSEREDSKGRRFFHPINGLVKMPHFSSNPSNEYQCLTALIHERPFDGRLVTARSDQDY